MKAIFVVLFLFGAWKSEASQVRWTARGEVTTISGGAFSETAAATGNAVEIVIVYDSDTLVDGRSFLPINGAIAGSAWFYGDANLAITVKIGANTWTGEMPNIPSGMNVMESACWDFAGNPDTFTVTLDAARGGNFPSFPHTGNETTRSLKLQFRDDTSPAELFDVHVLPDSLTNVCAMTSATGAIQAGISTLAFTIDPASVNITLPQVPVSIARTGEGIQLSWETVLGKSYRIEGSSDLRCWSDEGVYYGTGNPRQVDLTPFETYTKRFYRISEL